MLESLSKPHPQWIEALDTVGVGFSKERGHVSGFPGICPGLQGGGELSFTFQVLEYCNVPEGHTVQCLTPVLGG